MKNGKKLTAAEVRELPEGSWVILQGRDRRGYTTTRRCMVVKGERAKRLQYFDTRDGGYLPIRELDGIDRLYYVETEV